MSRKQKIPNKRLPLKNNLIFRRNIFRFQIIKSEILMQQFKEKTLSLNE